MAGLSLREAAKEANVSKSTILRAVRNGRLSATRTEYGGYSIDSGQLFRVYEPRGRKMKVFATGLLAAAALIVGYQLPHQSQLAVTWPAVAPQVTAPAAPNPNSMAASNGPGLVADTGTAPRRIDLVQTQAASETSGRSVSEPGGDATGAPQPASISVATVPTVDASAPLSASPSPRRISRQLEASEIAELLRRGNEIAANGDLLGARLLFQRAAEAGDSSAALALAGTYDPLVLERLGERGLAPDVALARFWYGKARELGSKEAPQRLERLATQAN
jgi:excisionase family DNA binding protein